MCLANLHMQCWVWSLIVILSVAAIGHGAGFGVSLLLEGSWDGILHAVLGLSSLRIYGQALRGSPPPPSPPMVHGPGCHPSPFVGGGVGSLFPPWCGCGVLGLWGFGLRLSF